MSKNRHFIALSILVLAASCVSAPQHIPMQPDLADAALIVSSWNRTSDVIAIAAVAYVDGVLATRTKRQLGFSNPEDLEVKASPGDRKLGIVVQFTKRGFWNLISLRSGPFDGAGIIDASLEHGKTYLAKADFRDKTCYVWLEELSTGKKITSEIAVPHEPSRTDSTGLMLGAIIRGIH